MWCRSRLLHQNKRWIIFRQVFIIITLFAQFQLSFDFEVLEQADALSGRRRFYVDARIIRIRYFIFWKCRVHEKFWIWLRPFISTLVIIRKCCSHIIQILFQLVNARVRSWWFFRNVRHARIITLIRFFQSRVKITFFAFRMAGWSRLRFPQSLCAALPISTRLWEGGFTKSLFHGLDFIQIEIYSKACS